MDRQKTEVVSFRVPKDVFEHIEVEAERRGKVRADFVKEIFLPVFRQIANIEKQDKEPVLETL
jgi:predicted DNA-binding protein